MDSTPKAATTRDGDRATVQLSGYISGSAESLVAPAFAEAVEALRIVVAFAPDCFLSSAGIAVLPAMVLPLKDQGKHVRLGHPQTGFQAGRPRSSTPFREWLARNAQGTLGAAQGETFCEREMP